MNDVKSISCTDWSVFAGEQPVRFVATCGYGCDGGEQIFRSHSGDRQLLHYDPDEELLIIRGRKWKGLVSIDGETVKMKKSAEKNAFVGKLPRAGFQRMLERLKDSECRHRDAQIRRIKDYGD